MTWLPALRIARREALRAKGRSALIVAMVALPVLGIGGADILFRSAELDPDERVTRVLGQMQARVTSMGGGRVIQAPDPDRGGASSLGGPVGSAVPEPAGYRVLIAQEGTLTFRTAGGIAPLAVNQADVGDPAFDGKFVVEAGRPPQSKGEVAVTRPALDRLGTEVGGTATVAGAGHSFRIVGIVEEVGSRGPQTVWALPGTLLTSSVSEEVSPTAYLAGQRPVSWADILRLNRQGFVVYSRAVVLDPPPRSAVPYFTRGFDVGNTQETLIAVLAATLVVTLAVLEVVLLAGAAFAVGARRQERSLGLVTAAGGEGRDVRRVGGQGVRRHLPEAVRHVAAVEEDVPGIGGISVGVDPAPCGVAGCRGGEGDLKGACRDAADVQQRAVVERVVRLPRIETIKGASYVARVGKVAVRVVRRLDIAKPVFIRAVDVEDDSVRRHYVECRNIGICNRGCAGRGSDWRICRRHAGGFQNTATIDVQIVAARTRDSGGECPHGRRALANYPMPPGARDRRSRHIHTAGAVCDNRVARCG
jgi:hypothetical protein